jgi:hypothetical protein
MKKYILLICLSACGSEKPAVKTTVGTIQTYQAAIVNACGMKFLTGVTQVMNIDRNQIVPDGITDYGSCNITVAGTVLTSSDKVIEIKKIVSLSTMQLF